MKAKELKLKDLPSSLYNTIKSINDTMTTLMLVELKNYPKLDKKMITDFCKLPKEKTNVSSVVLYKNKNKYSCMIQISNHIDTKKHNNGLRKLIKTVHKKLSDRVYKMHGFVVKSEYDKKKKFEGFDVWLQAKLSKSLWDKYDVEIKDFNENYNLLIADSSSLPDGLQESLFETFSKINNYFNKFKDKYIVFENVNISNPNTLIITKDGDSYDGRIRLTRTEAYSDYTVEKTEQAYSKIFNGICCNFNEHSPCKELVLDGTDFIINLSEEYSKLLYEYYVENDTILTNINESTFSDDMKSEPSLKKAKSLLSSFTSDIMNNNGITTDKSIILLNEILSNQLLPAMKIPFQRVKVIAHENRSNLIEFKLPQFGSETLMRFIDGRETLDGFIHSDPNICIYLPKSIFNSFKNSNDLYTLMNKAIRYYNSGFSVYSDNLISLLMKHRTTVKQTFSNKDISAVIHSCISYLFRFEYMYGMDFKKNKDDINKIFYFIKNINKQDDLLALIDLLNRLGAIKNADNIIANINKYYSNLRKHEIKRYAEAWEVSNIDANWRTESTDQLKYIVEKFGVKKLKKIPRDLIAYITIETECIKDNNDKMMLASYTLGKIELVEWYIELLEVGSKKYVVPQTKPELERIRIALMECYSNIMKVKIAEKKEVDWKMPAGYEG